MAQAEIAWQVGVVRHRQNAAGTHYLVVGYDERTVVERTVLEENVLDEAHVDVGVDYVASVLVVVKRHGALNDDECAGFGLRHAKLVRFRPDLTITDCTYEKVFGND